ncbi:hypothetical protein O181_034694 [Austropuccinia psidii MF-1]|uniref:Uncharacterized protein n=1 Tax=Austropuccinia psidii MF-1 TaxID=1389203 RepID=A0A9Q3H9T1_9BASI|nr:hypothetical protein [Austropuccinia psidii MF-1]
MSSKLTELTESSPSALPPYVLHGSSIISQFSSPSMASSGHFNPPKFMMVTRQSAKCHYCFIGKKPWRKTGNKASNVRRYLWSKKNGPFRKEFPVSEAPTLDVTGSRQRDVARWTNVGGPIYYSSEVPISRINTEGIVKRIRQIANSPPDPDAEGSDYSPPQPPAKRFQSKVIPSTPRNFQPTLATIPTSIPPALPHQACLESRSKTIHLHQSRNSPIVNSQQPQPVASTSRRREELSPLPFPAAQVFQCRD